MIIFEVKPTSRFRKDYKLMEKRGMPIDLLDEIIIQLAEGKPLSAHNRDHELIGNWVGHRECHIIERTEESSDCHSTGCYAKNIECVRSCGATGRFYDFVNVVPG